MTVNSVTPATRAAPPAEPGPARPQPDLVQRFAAAVKRGDVPLPPRQPAGKGPHPALSPGIPARPPAPAHGRPPTTPAPALAPPEEHPDLTGFAPQLAPLPQAAGLTAPAPVTPQVDPAAFADMLNQLWLREQNRTVRDVRVRFGDAAWPATGARLQRLPDGSLQVEVLIDRHARRGNGDSLRAHLSARGLPIAGLTISDDDGSP